MALQKKNKFEGLGDIILRVMSQLLVPFSVEVTVPRSRHRQADITSPSMFEGDQAVRQKSIDVRRVPTNDNRSDLLTKSVKAPTFSRLALEGPPSAPAC
jgi:hypothetical protein